MHKKVSIIVIISIALSLVFYGCSSMKHSTVVLYVSHKLEGPIYMPQAEAPVSAQDAQSENRANQGKEPNRRQSRKDNSKENDKTTQNAQDSKENDKTAQSAQDSKENDKTTQSAQDSKENGKTTTSRRPSRRQQQQQQQQDNIKDIQVTSTNTYDGGYKTRTMRRGEFLILDKPIRFAFEKYDIPSSYDDSVRYVANYLREYTNVRLIVEGHTDRVGEFGFNKGLSMRRSRTAISKLIKEGIDKNRLIENGVSYRFAEYNFNRLNRRVEFIIIRSEEDLTNYRTETAE